MIEVNVPLLRKAVEWVEAQAAIPEIDREWEQSLWLTPPDERACDLLYGSGFASAASLIEPHCGTAFCVAGKIAADADPRYATASVVDGVHSSEVAARELGIDVDDAEDAGGLFNGYNTAADIRRIAETIAGERL